MPAGMPPENGASRPLPPDMFARAIKTMTNHGMEAITV